MKIILSPAKTFNLEAKSGINTPIFLNKSQNLIDILKTMNKDKLQKELKISEKLANSVYNYYQTFELKYAAAYLYAGQAFKYLKADEINANELINLYMLSPLYGIVNALDNISLYRLDMKDRIIDKSLYDYWYDDINNYINTFSDDLIINLSSGEFSRLLNLDNPKIITINFGVIKDDKLVQQSMLIKKMRGMMANYLLTNSIKSLNEIKNIELDGFKYNTNYSDNKTLIFTK